MIIIMVMLIAMVALPLVAPRVAFAALQETICFLDGSESRSNQESTIPRAVAVRMPDA